MSLANLLRLLCMLPMAAWSLTAEAAAPASMPISPTDVVSSILEYRLAREAINLEDFALVERWISPGLMQACRGYLTARRSEYHLPGRAQRPRRSRDRCAGGLR